MLSRVADSVYWMSRYIERAENYARFLDVNFNLSLELHPNAKEQWKPLVVVTGDSELFEAYYKSGAKKNVIRFLAFDERNPNSIYSCIVNARENGRAIRPEITKEVWEQINSLYYLVKEGQDKKYWEKKDPRKFFDRVKKGCQLLYGILDSTISKTEGWHFVKIGQLIERADKTSRILDVKYHLLLPDPEMVGSALDLIQWSTLLKSVSAYDMYRRKYGKLTPWSISEFLIFDKNFPRSILSCLLGAEQSLKSITRSDQGSFSNSAEKKIGLLRSQLEYADINDIFGSGLHEYLDDLQLKLNQLSTSIFETFFSTKNIVNLSSKTFQNGKTQ